MTTLVKPSAAELPAYVEALRRGWSPDNVRGIAAAEAELASISENAARFVELMEDREALGAPITLPDGRVVPRLPGFRRWIWDDGFCGNIGLRWQDGTSELPSHVLGHVGYAVVPWKRGRGHATRALALLLPEARAVGLAFLELTTDPDNLPSQRVILANGGRMVERFRKHEAYGGQETLRWRIDL